MFLFHPCIITYRYFLVAHNATFDAKKLIKAIVQSNLQNVFEHSLIGFTDTLSVLKKVLPDRKGPGMFTLTTLAQEFLDKSDLKNNNENGNFHDALFDVKMLQKIICFFGKEELLLQHKKTYNYYIEEENNADIIAKNLPSLKSLKGLVSDQMIKRMAKM